MAETEDERLVWAQSEPPPSEHTVASRVIFSGIFAVIAIVAAAGVCYLSLSRNGQLLGHSPNFMSYVSAIIISGGWLVFPIIVGATSAVFIAPLKLPWFGLVLVCLGTVMLHKVEPSFALLPVYAILLFGSWWLAFHVLKQAQNWVALPMSIVCVGIIAGGVIWYAEFTENQAESKARALCASTPNGMKVEEVLARARRDEAQRDHVRWVQILELGKSKEGDLRVIYRGSSLMRLYTCEIKAANGVVASATYSLN